MSNVLSFKLNYIFFILSISVGLNNIVIGYKIFGVSLDRILQLIIFVFFCYLYTDLLNKKATRNLMMMVLSLLLLYMFTQLSLSIQGEIIQVTDIIRGLVRTFTYFAFVFVIVVSLDKYPKTIPIILSVYFLAFILAFFQNSLTPFTSFAQELRAIFFSNNMKASDFDIYNGFLEDEGRNFMRVTGPYGQTITLSYALVSAAIIATYKYVTNSKITYVLYVIFCLVVAIMTLTRSAVLAIMILLFFIFFKDRRSIYAFLISIFITIITLLLAGDDLILFERVISADESSSGKLGLLVAGVSALLIHPFGVTESNYYNTKVWVYELFQNPEILKYPSHNGLVNLGFEYSSLVYIPLCLFFYSYYLLGRRFNKNERVFWIAAMFSFFAQQSFHNNGIFYVEFNILIVLSIFISNSNALERKFK